MGLVLVLDHLYPDPPPADIDPMEPEPMEPAVTDPMELEDHGADGNTDGHHLVRHPQGGSMHLPRLAHLTRLARVLLMSMLAVTKTKTKSTNFKLFLLFVGRFVSIDPCSSTNRTR